MRWLIISIISVISLKAYYALRIAIPSWDKRNLRSISLEHFAISADGWVLALITGLGIIRIIWHLPATWANWYHWPLWLWLSVALFKTWTVRNTFLALTGKQPAWKRIRSLRRRRTEASPPPSRQ